MELGVGSVFSGYCNSCFLGTLAGVSVGVFGLVGAALALGGWVGGLGDSVRIGLSVGWTSSLLATIFLGRIGAGSHFSVGITSFGIGGFDLDGFATLLGGSFGGSSFVIILGVSVDSRFALVSLRVLRGSSGGGASDGCATLELLLQNKEAGIG